MTSWATKPTLAGYTSLADVEAGTAAADRTAADAIPLALLELAYDGDQLAGRTVLQLMLGKAVRIAASYTGRADRDLLEQLAVSALSSSTASSTPNCSRSSPGVRDEDKKQYWRHTRA